MKAGVVVELKEMSKCVRAELKLSQRELGALINSNQTEVSFIERGFMPSKDKVFAIEKIHKTILDE